MYTEALCFLIPCFAFAFACYRTWRSPTAVPDWPVIGMLPSVLRNLHRVHDYATEIIVNCGGTFLLKGPRFAEMDMLLTSDPANVHYILTKNFGNFGKGSDFRVIFDVWGDGIFAVESEMWENQRKIAKLFIGNALFQQFTARTTWEKVKSSLFPLLETASRTGEILDFQNVLERLAFDFTCISVLGHDPNSVAEESAAEKAFSYHAEGVFYRHVVPVFLWKFLSFLRIGTERKMAAGRKTIDEFMSESISLREEEVNRKIDDRSHDMLSCYLRIVRGKSDQEITSISRQVWRDALLNFIFAGKDTISSALTWFFWVIGNHPDEEEKIRREITTVLGTGEWNSDGRAAEEIKKLVYLHAALCETLRLFPPVPLQHKSPLNDDVLPSGHLVKRNERIVLSFYSMGRMESIWGKDCGEFRPARWFSDEGTMKLIPAFKFPAFNAGPRSCIGKEISFVQMKIVIAAVLSRFKIAVVDGDDARARASIVLQLEDGLKTRVTKL